MINQLEIFEHGGENNRQSQDHYDNNAPHFSNQCRIVLKLLRDGYRLTSYDAMVVHGIGHLARRIKDLKDAGIEIKGEFLNGEKFKTYYI